MYIEPNTTIKLYSGVPLDNTYNHTLYFASESEQQSYFSTSKYTFSAQSYQRVERGKMRIERKADDLYDCNYLAFKNVNYGNKWFYAFITSVEYINNVTSEITFEIDVMQTYLFDVELKDCFVEREHSETDVIGENIQAEPIETGEYVISDYGLVGAVRDMLVLIMIADETSTSFGDLYEGIYGGCDIWAYNSTDTTNITSKVSEYIQKPDQIIAMYMCPKMLVPGVTNGGKHLSYSTTSSFITETLPSVTEESQDFEGYEPKNKKLYTYPYNFLRIDNASGQSLNLRYEFFDNLTPVIEIQGTFLMPVKLVARPCSYKGLPSYSELGGYTSSKSEAISLENYPMCSWNVDTFKSWLAQNSVPVALNSISSVTSSAIASHYSAHPTASFGVGTIGTVASVLSQMYTASIAADQCRGNISNGNVNVARNIQEFYKQRCHVTKDFAIVIDNFFSMYGYATNKVKQPNISSRPHWNYVKTLGCVVVGRAPSDDIKKMCSIYDNGITFWKNANEVGDYSLDNSV
jgi:hypothetical protein